MGGSTTKKNGMNHVEVNLAILPAVPRFPQVCWPCITSGRFFLERKNQQVSPWVKMTQIIQLKGAVYKWMATRFPCKNQGFANLICLLKKPANYDAMMGGFCQKSCCKHGELW